jgi:hypothetical protein
MTDQEKRLNDAGFFLRDDRDIREGVEAFKGIEEAYSLYSLPFRRHHVFGGPRDWAVDRAYSLVFPQHPQQYEQWLGRRVTKITRKPFKSGSRSNTVKGIIEHPVLKHKPAFTFDEDESFVACHVCQLDPEG